VSDPEQMIDGINPDDPWTPMTSGLRYYFTANSPRALTDSPIMRHRKGDGHTDIGAFS